MAVAVLRIEPREKFNGCAEMVAEPLAPNAPGQRSPRFKQVDRTAQQQLVDSTRRSGKLRRHARAIVLENSGEFKNEQEGRAAPPSQAPALLARAALTSSRFLSSGCARVFEHTIGLFGG